MIVRIHPTDIQGTVHAPASKSSMQRACAAALLCKGTSNIFNPGKSNDDLAAIDVIKKLGAKVITNQDGPLTVESNGIQPVESEIKCGESGLGIRMFTPIAALSNLPLTIGGSGSLLTRPMDFFDKIFPQLGIKIESAGGRLPLKICGPLIPQDIEVDGSLSSQFLTGLLMAFSSSIKNQVTIKVNDLKSKPYIDLTLQVMKDFGMNVPANDNYNSFTFSPFNRQPLTINYTVEGDWSGAAFLLVAGAIAGNITVTGLNINSTQADKNVLQALISCGCSLSIQDKQIEIGPAPLKAFHFDATDCPDLFPPLVALAAYCKGTSVIEGTSRLQHKESNRALTLQEEFGKMGVEITLENNLMLVKGGEGVNGASVHSRHDHRIAMACAVAALKANGEVEIADAEAINKSYPDFYQHMASLNPSGGGT
ncbi:MAG: 3-phosphoshikimate 1-carboxyvinyltransferase [Segetibacter sp.]|nr:3-phosphoshikimate 1-carboxyvinyltransferase [Segetibacter sp.]